MRPSGSLPSLTSPQAGSAAFADLREAPRRAAARRRATAPHEHTHTLTHRHRHTHAHTHTQVTFESFTNLCLNTCISWTLRAALHNRWMYLKSMTLACSARRSVYMAMGDCMTINIRTMWDEIPTQTSCYRYNSTHMPRSARPHGQLAHAIPENTT